MEIKINHSEVNRFCDASQNQSEFMREKILFWKEKLTELQGIWQGEDADAFFENAFSYIERLNIIPECYDSLSNFVGSANKEYYETDMEGKKQFEKDAMEEDYVKNNYYGY